MPQPIPVDTPAGVTPPPDRYVGMTVDSNQTAPDTLVTPKPAAEPVADAPVVAESPESEAGRVLAGKKKTLEGRKASIQQEIDALTRGKHDAKRELDELETRRATMRAELEALKPTETPKVTGKPTEDQVGTVYSTYADFIEALSEYKARELLTADREERQKATAQTAQHRALQTLHERGTAAFPDFDEVLTTFAELGQPMSPPVARFILRHSDGHKLAHHLATHPDVSERISALEDDTLVGFELGRLLTETPPATSGPVRVPPPVVPAKPLIKPVSATPLTQDGPPGDDASDEEHRVYMNAQEAARRFRRA